MNLQNNSDMARSYIVCKSYFKFIGFLSAFLLLLTLAEIFINENHLHFIVTFIGYLFFAISSIPIFILWELSKDNEKVTFFASYFIWLAIVPALWLALIYITLFLYSSVMLHCCENNQFLQMDIWYSLTHVYEKLTPQLFTGLFMYISFWLSMNITKLKALNLIAKGLAIMSFILFIFVTVVNFGI